MPGVLRPTLIVLTALAPAACQLRETDQSKAKPHPRGALWRWQQRGGPDGAIPRDGLLRAARMRDAMVQLDNAPVGVRWTWRGPGNIGGRVRAILIHPTQHDTMWVGSAGGGVWHTTDGGASWQPQNAMLPVLGIGCMAMDPTDPDRLYAGTGEGFFDTPAGSSNLAVMAGAGIFTSADGGASWNQLASTAAWLAVNRIAIDPNDPRVLLAATTGGLRRTADGGTTWTLVHAADTMDVRFHPTDSSRAIAGTGTGTALFSGDGGRTWQPAAGIGRAVRVELRYWAGNPNVVYAAVSNAGRIRVYRSNDGGQTYGLRTTSTAESTYSRYNNVLWVDPTNDQRLFVGGVRISRSTNGGQSFTQTVNGGYYDYHVLVEHPAFNGTTNRTLFSGSDGGVHRLADVAQSSPAWRELNNNLGINQFYGAAINPISDVIVGGTQDQGNLRDTGGTESWVRPIFGDGGFVATDPTDARYFWAETQNLSLYRSSNGGGSFSFFGSGISEPDPNFVSPIVLDPSDPRRLYAGGARLWRTTNAKGSNPAWSSIKVAATCTTRTAAATPSHFALDPPCNISAIAVAPSDPRRLYVGHNDGQLWTTGNGLDNQPLWTRIDRGLPDRWVGRITVDPADARRVYVAMMGYAPDNVWRSTDAGQSWQRISGGTGGALPAAPVSGLTVHPQTPGLLFAGTDVGVFVTADDGTSWQAIAGGPGTVSVEELVWRDARTLMAVTHGRGIFTGTLDGGSVRGVGAGCGQTPPTLSATPPRLGLTQSYSANGAPPSSATRLLVAAGPAMPTPVGTCTLWPDLATLVDLDGGISTATGTWSTGVALPPDPTFLGLVLTAQAAFAAPGGPALGAAEVSNGVEMTLGF